MNRYTVIGTPTCKWCDSVKTFLDKKGENYNYIELGDGSDNLMQFFTSLGFRTVPQVWHGVHHIGGYEATVAYVKQTEFLSQ